MTHTSAPTGSETRVSSHGAICPQAQRSIPTSRRLPPLPWRTRDATSLSVKVTLRHRECLADAQPSTPEQHHKRPGPQSVRSLAGDAHHRHDLLHRWRVGRVAPALVARRTAAMEAGHGRGRAATARGVEPGRNSHAQQPLRLDSYAPASCRHSSPIATAGDPRAARSPRSSERRSERRPYLSRLRGRWDSAPPGKLDICFAPGLARSPCRARVAAAWG